MGVIPIVTYASIVVFFLAVLTRYLKIARLPMHLRWELYPVAHEKGRAQYGGSYLEELDWWKKERQSTLVGELKVMIPEILLLAGVWEHNRRHWYRTFPFHFGLYMLAGLVFLLVVGGIVIAAGGEVSAGAGALGSALFYITVVVGYVGLVLALIGTLALLGRRLFNQDYREYTKKGDFFNLYFFLVTLGVALIAHVAADSDFSVLRAYFARLLTFDISFQGAGFSGGQALVAAEIVLASLLLAYIPLTHMSHFFTKWFMYHHVRWSDEPNLPGGDFEGKIAEELKQPVSWAAPHIRGNGKKNWVDITTSGVEEKTE